MQEIERSTRVLLEARSLTQPQIELDIHVIILNPIVLHAISVYMNLATGR